jgi:hypothetical protein
LAALPAAPATVAMFSLRREKKRRGAFYAEQAAAIRLTHLGAGRVAAQRG